MDWIELAWADANDLEEGPDYIAFHGARKVARVYSDQVGKGPIFWRWFLHWYSVPNTGHADSRREAFLEVERLYNRFLAEGGAWPPLRGKPHGEAED